jgi:UDP-2,3-diacylglucosamine pyrophosphatase LpxH
MVLEKKYPGVVGESSLMSVGASKQSVFVISDLHLGGTPRSDRHPGFQMCPESNRKRLIQFLDWLIEEQNRSRRIIHLVINGDSVDFLSEEPFGGVLADESVVIKKLHQVFKHTEEVWDGLEKALAKGVRLSLLLGNHDIELGYPNVRAALLVRLHSEAVNFLYDNQALSIGSVIVEHGNRYDPVNAVDHNCLRQIRSQISRREVAGNPPNIIGSELVGNFLNEVKTKYPFLDLLKPELMAALPSLAAVDPALFGRDVFRDIVRAAMPSARTCLKHAFLRDEYHRPRDPGAIGSSQVTSWRKAGQDELADIFCLTVPANRGQIGALNNIQGFWDTWRTLRQKDEVACVSKTLQALNHFKESCHSAFELTREEEGYYKPARALAENGSRVIVFGHTHLAKRVNLGNGALYLNTGTWADLMAVPEAVWSPDAELARITLSSFIQSLRDNTLDHHRKLKATFARIDLDGETVEQSDLYEFTAQGDATLMRDNR